MKQPMKLHPTEYSTVQWYWTAPVGQTLEDVLKPEYWVHVTNQLRPGHEIDVAAEDRTFCAKLFVRSVGSKDAHLGVIYKAYFDAIDAETESDDTYVKWRSPTSKFGVFRKTDNECLKDGFDTKEAAFSWSATRNQSIAA